MAKGKKIDLSDYQFEETFEETDTNGKPVLDEATGDIKTSLRMLTIKPKKVLPGLLCHPSIGAEPGRSSPGYDLMELYPISEEISQAKNKYVLLNENEYATLLARVKVLGQFLGRRYGPMLMRIKKAEEVELGEKAK